MNEHKDEILLPVLDSDATAVPRYNIVGPDGKVLYKNVSLKLMNGIAQEGTPINKPLLDEFLAAAGVTAGTATAFTLVQKGYSLFDGAEVRFRLHRASGSGATLNVNGTGAKPLRDAMGESMASGMPAGTWLKAIYSAAAGAYTISGGATNVTPADIGAVNKAGDTMANWARFYYPISDGTGGVIYATTGGFVFRALADASNLSGDGTSIKITPSGLIQWINTANGSTIYKEILHTGNLNKITTDSITQSSERQFVTAAEKAAWNAGGNGGAKMLTDVRLTSNTASVAITLPTDYNYFRIVISGITVTTSATVKVDCNAATRRHEGIWLFDIMENNEPGIAGIETERYNRLIDVAVPDVESMASITMDAHRTPSGMQGQATAVASDGGGAGTGEINIGTWYADQNNLTEITVSVSSGYMRAGTGIMVVGVK